MKYSLLPIALLVSSVTCLAQTAFDREMSTLKTQRDAAVVASTKAIDERYRTALEQVYRRALQAKDNVSAERLKAELLTLGPLRDAPVTGGAAPAKPSLPANMLGEWKVSTASGWTAVYNFKADGTCERIPGSAKVPDKVATWSKQGNKIEIVWPDGSIQTLELPIKEKKLEGLSPDGSRLWAVKQK